MALLQARAERPVAAPPDRVYSYLADYRQHHHRFLPPAFSDYAVEQGGFGAGTVVSVRITSAGQTRAYRLQVSEPEPGRVLVETDRQSGTVTTFTVLPEGQHSRVRIQTTWPAAGGLSGLLERLLAPAFAGRLFADEIARLDRYAREQAALPTSQPPPRAES